MADLTASDVAVSVPTNDRDIGGGGVFKNLSLASITFGDGAKTYPSGGVPLPAIGHFGLKRQLQLLLIQQPVANGFVYKYDAENNKIKIFTQGFSTGATAAGAAENGALVKNSAGTEATAPRMPKTAINTIYDMGGLIELPTTIAPAAVTLKALAIGE